MPIGILVVDDLRFMRTIIRDILESAGIEVIGEAENGVECLDLYEEKQPDIVLLDITMPVMDGIETLRELKRKYSDSTIIMCSALGQQEYIIKAIQLGAKDFIVKPFNPERMLSAIHKASRRG
jgi:two-component system, chemotaxis family, chemotaxis protein CheY